MRVLLVALTALAAVGWLRTAQAADFLEPDQAFQLAARLTDGRTVELDFQIAKGYYLYRERLAVEAGPASVQLGTIAYPAGQVKFDETFQKNVETYHDRLQVRVPVTVAPAEFRLAVTSQGCAEAGLCYPPRQQVLKLRVDGGALRQVTLLSDEAGAAYAPAAGAVAQTLVAAASADAGAGANRNAAVGASADLNAKATSAAPSGDGVTAALQSGSLLSVVGVFFLAGVLLSFTPCVLPMVPILSSIIVGQTRPGTPVSRWRGLSLSLAYALGMALVYTALGVAAGLAGEGLAAALQNPWVLGAFALLLLGLSLSMFGFYELQLPAALQSRLTETSTRLPGGNAIGVFVMGGISALIVGPCVAAPLAGALVYISQTRDVVLGGLALFALACGMSMPLLLVGASAGSLLPRSGAWMEGVKRCFGVLLIGVAIWMVTPVLPAWAVMAAWGVLLLVSAVYLGLLDPVPESARHGTRGFSHLLRGVALVLALLGAAQWVGVLSGGRSVLQPLAHLGGASLTAGAAGVAQLASTSAQAAPAGQAAKAATGVSVFRRVKSVAELDAVIKAAGKPVMLDFYADWCVSCKEFEQFTFRDPEVQARLAGAVLVQADVTANDADDRALLKRFALFGPPGIVFFDPQGTELTQARVIGYQDAPSFLRSLGRAGI
ncbi:MAG: protein-disulfide reductase DsbD [Leptothrix sp. (in: b-proteobacteria)]